MAEFNPYRVWLQISLPAGETPTYYKLLGLPDFEENPQTISKAAEKQLSRLLAINPEKHRPQWQKLINELAEAQSTLTHPQHKTNYDNRLRGVTTPAAESTAALQPNSTAASRPSSTPAAATPAAATPVAAQPSHAPAPLAPAYPAYGQPNYQNPNYANPVAAQPQYGQPVYQPPVYGQQPPTAAPYAQPYGQPQYAAPVYGQPVQAQPAQAQPVQAQPVYGQPVYGQPVYGQSVYGQPVQPAPYDPSAYAQPVFNPAPASSASPFGFTQPASPVYEATAAHDPFAPSGLPNPMAPANPMAPVGANSGFGAFGASAPGAYSTAIAPMAPLNNSRSPLPGSSQSYVEEDSSFRAPVAKPNVYRAKPQESPVKYFLIAVGVLVVILGGLVLNSVLGTKKNTDAPVAQTEPPAPAKKGKPSPEVVPVSTPAEPKPAEPKHTEPKNTEPKNTDPMPAQPEPMKPVPMKPEMPKPEPAQPEPAKPMPEPMKPEPPKTVVKKPEPTPEPAKPMPAPMPANATPEEKKIIVAKLAEARQFVSERKFSDAKRVLKEAGELAKTPDVQDLHEGMELVVNYNEQFWQAVKTSMRTATGEIQIGASTKANIVSSSAEEITIHLPGKNSTYTFEELSSKAPGLAIALADRWFDKNPANLAAKASYQLARKNGKLDEARTLLTAAQSGGVDTKFILKLLDEPGVIGN